MRMSRALAMHDFIAHMYLERVYLTPSCGLQALASSLSSLRGFQGLSDKDLDRLHSLLKLPKKQIHLAFECIKQKEAAQQEEDGCVEITDGKDVQTQYRLMVGAGLTELWQKFSVNTSSAVSTVGLLASFLTTHVLVQVKRRLAKECKSSYVINGELQKDQFQAALNEGFKDLDMEYRAMAKRLRMADDDEPQVSTKRLKDEQTN